MNSQLHNEIFNKVFKDIKGYEGLYKISKNGEIWSCLHNKFKIPQFDKGKYYIGLMKNKIQKKYNIEKLLELQQHSNINIKINKELKNDIFNKELKNDIFNKELKNDIFNKELKNDIFNKELKNDIFNKVFQDLKGYEGLYKISKNGEIWSCFYNKIYTSHINEDGYLKITLTNSSKKQTKCSIHRLLALQFILNPDNKPEVDHIDRNKLNNSLSNLRWVTRIENRRNRPDIITDIEAWKINQKIYHQNYHKKMYIKKQQLLGITPLSEIVVPITEIVVPITEIVVPITEIVVPITEIVVPITEIVVLDHNPFIYDIMRFELLFDTIRMQELLLRKTRFNVWMNYHLCVLEELQIYFNKNLL